MGFVLKVDTNYICSNVIIKMPRMKYVHRRRLRRILYSWCACLSLVTIFFILNMFRPGPRPIDNKLYVYWMSTDAELEADMEWDLDDVPNIVTTRIKTFDHKVAIQKAYDERRPIALIIQDGVHFSNILFEQWEQIIATAPADWSMLQLWTNNSIIRKHGESLHDPWIAWFPQHTSQEAFFINRNGMRSALQNKGTLFNRAQTYTSTQPYAKSKQLVELATQVPRLHALNKSILIITTTVIENQTQFQQELADWKRDFLALTAKWHLTIIVRNPTMKQFIKQHWPKLPNLKLSIEQLQGQYNKFQFIRESIDDMKSFKHVIIKDSDIGLSGFPWQTFFDAQKNAAGIAGSVITGALRQIKTGLDKRQWFKFQDGNTWKTQYPKLFTNIKTHKVPFLEQFFVMMEGSFANWFFTRTLTDTFLINDDNSRTKSNWGPDTLWCGAAKQWAPFRTPCLLVPVIAIHRDTRQVLLWNSSAHRKYINMRQNQKYRRAFSKWLFYDSSDITHELEPV